MKINLNWTKKKLIFIPSRKKCRRSLFVTLHYNGKDELQEYNKQRIAYFFFLLALMIVCLRIIVIMLLSMSTLEAAKGKLNPTKNYVSTRRFTVRFWYFFCLDAPNITILRSIILWSRIFPLGLGFAFFTFCDLQYTSPAFNFLIKLLIILHQRQNSN